MSADNLARRLESFDRDLDPETSTHLARSGFAAILLDEYVKARQGGIAIDTFQSDGSKVLDFLELSRFGEVDTYQPLADKRQPSLRESFDATLERFKVLDQLENIFGDSTSAIAYGGSMKYGPFMNVRSGANASDIDLIIVAKTTMLEESSWQGLMETDQISEADKLTFFARQALQRQLLEQGKIDIMSQRFEVADAEYTISSHIIPPEFVPRMYPQDKVAIHDGHMYVRDYKERTFERPQCTNYDMNRTVHGVPVYNKPIDGGFIVSNAAYSMVDGHYVPGMYQNLVLPDAKLAHDATGKVAQEFATFSTVISQIELQERTISPDASIENTEPRLPILAQNIDIPS